MTKRESFVPAIEFLRQLCEVKFKKWKNRATATHKSIDGVYVYEISNDFIDNLLEELTRNGGWGYIELLEFKNKILNLCGVLKIKDIGNVLYNKVLSHDIDFFDKYNSIVDDTKDWLQALWQYYEADRTEKKQDYTPKSLCKLVASLAGKAKSIYDCCGGSGALTKSFIDMYGADNVFVEELDERVIPFLLFNLSLHNINGYVVNGDVLTGEKEKMYKLSRTDKYSVCELIEDVEEVNVDISISNPPYNIKWQPPTPLEMDIRFPIIPPASNANYAFVFNCLSKANKAVMILPNGIMSERLEYDCRKYLVDNDLVEIVAIMPDKMFEVTTISTCILVLNKNKANKGEICFIDSRKNYIVEERNQNGQFGGTSHINRTYKKAYNVLSDENINRILTAIKNRENVSEFSAVVKNETVSENEYILMPSRYIAFEEQEHQHRDFQEIADNINYISRMQNSCKLVINETIAKKLGLDVEIYKQAKKNSIEISSQMKALGINVEVDDYIQFTKNKNQFIFKCNDKDIFPDILLQFFTIWKNQIALLNTMQNQYLTELRDSLLPDLMSGKIELT